nr:PREDICTED: uncharacterized protein LOC106703966 isoform X2 [Latimeria chalumnae]|eukprot:XP_014345442.1 PREDICTED: uncharacterized protein LOC106703966 isoform X2 [Latimeria chalumnae]
MHQSVPVSCIVLLLICTSFANDAKERWFKQTPYSRVQKNESVIINCTMSKHTEIVGLYVKRFIAPKENVLYVKADGSGHTIDDQYKTRLTWNRIESNEFQVTISKLQVDDTDVYICEFGIRSEMPYKGSGTLITVTDESEKGGCPQLLQGDQTLFLTITVILDEEVFQAKRKTVWAQ